MKDDQNSLGGSVNRFQTTRWDMVLHSAQSKMPGCKEALADLCNRFSRLPVDPTSEQNVQLRLVRMLRIRKTGAGKVRREFERRLAAGEISQRHLESMLMALRRLNEKFGQCANNQNTGSEIKVWLSSSDLSTKTRNNLLLICKIRAPSASLRVSRISASLGEASPEG
jgi:hypothetical protein